MHSTTSHFQRRGQAVSNKQTMATWRLASGVEGTLATLFAFVKPQWFVNETLLLFHLLGFYFFFSYLVIVVPCSYRLGLGGLDGWTHSGFCLPCLTVWIWTSNSLHLCMELSGGLGLSTGQVFFLYMLNLFFCSIFVFKSYHKRVVGRLNKRISQRILIGMYY
jgi:hypothetical protein